MCSRGSMALRMEFITTCRPEREGKNQSFQIFGKTETDSSPEIEISPNFYPPLCRWRLGSHVLIHVTVQEFDGGKEFHPLPQQWKPMLAMYSVDHVSIHLPCRYGWTLLGFEPSKQKTSWWIVHFLFLVLPVSAADARYTTDMYPTFNPNCNLWKNPSEIITHLFLNCTYSRKRELTWM